MRVVGRCRVASIAACCLLQSFLSFTLLPTASISTSAVTVGLLDLTNASASGSLSVDAEVSRATGACTGTLWACFGITRVFVGDHDGDGVVRAVCGNNRCEIGETCNDFACTGGCRVDCPIASLWCPSGYNADGAVVSCSGHGSCTASTGTCACSIGYTGSSCNTCAAQYMRVSTHKACVFMPGAFTSCTDNIRNGNEEGVDCGGPNCPACKAKSSTMFTSIIKLSIIVSAGSLVLFVLYSVFCRKRKTLPDVTATGVKETADVLKREPVVTSTQARRQPGRQSIESASSFPQKVAPTLSPLHPDNRTMVQQGQWTAERVKRAMAEKSMSSTEIVSLRGPEATHHHDARGGGHRDGQWRSVQRQGFI